MNFKVLWGRDKSQFFLEGSVVQYDEASASVYLKNAFFSPSSVVVAWHSKLDYAKIRTFFELPLLKRGHSYRLSSQAFVRPSGGVQLKLNFYDRTLRLLESQVFELEGGDFIYPLEAYAYGIELINVGMEELLFDALFLEEID